MFQQFSNIVYSGTATSSDNTDNSLSGTSKQVIFSSLNDTFILDFDAVDISAWDEITMQIYFSTRINSIGTGLLQIDIGSDVYTIESVRSGWNHITIDAANYNNLSQITFTGLNPGMYIWVDLLGYRKVDNATVDFDVVDSIKSAISLTYGVSTTLASDVTTADESISLTDHDYIFDRTQLYIDDGANSETVTLIDRSTIDGTFQFNHSAGTTVTAKCPTVGEDQIGEDYDPICGIVISSKSAHTSPFVDKLLGTSKDKDYVSELGITIYIEATAKSKVLELSAEFNKNYGKEFQIILDGELVNMYLDTSTFSDTTLGSLPRMAYFYNITPQPVTKAKRIDIDTFTINMESTVWN